jgi:cytochrome c oxidase subunit 2
LRNKPEFNYELACQEVCGGGHWNMRRVIVVDTKEDYEKWVKAQKTTYAALLEGNAPAPATPADSTKKVEPAKVASAN